MLKLASSDIATLNAPVAMHGAIRSADIAADEIFEMMVAIVVVVYQG